MNVKYRSEKKPVKSSQSGGTSVFSRINKKSSESNDGFKESSSSQIPAWKRK